MAGRRSCAVLLLALPHATALLVRAGLAHGYKEDFQYVGKFGFSASTEELPAKIRLLAWTFIPGQRLLIYKNDDWFQAYRDEPERAVLTGDGVQTRLSSLCERRAALATVSLPVAQGAFYGEAGEVIEQDIVQEEPAFWFLALARCQEWVDALENATAGADKCMGSRQYGNVPNGVFMYYELRLYNPECAGGPTCSYWTKELSVDEHGLYEMHLFFVSMLGWLLLAQVVTMLCRWSSQTLFAMPQLAALTTGTPPRNSRAFIMRNSLTADPSHLHSRRVPAPRPRNLLLLAPRRHRAAAAVGAADRELLRVRGDRAAHDARADAREGDTAHFGPRNSDAILHSAQSF